ncbi:MAG: hypothetical protein MI802_24150, partial [Desulfobacterales bacterium]|nr:hypothetical protein [Desulfobacterales bacterium]
MTMESIRKFVAKNRIAGITGVVLTVLLGSLVLVNYRSQLKLQNALRDHMFHNLELHTARAKDFFLERRLDLLGLSQTGELSEYFSKFSAADTAEKTLENKLDQVRNRFHVMIQDHSYEGIKLFSGIAIYDREGARVLYVGDDGLSDDFSGADVGEKDEFPGQEVEFRIEGKGSDLMILMDMPFVYNGRWQGYVVAQLNIETVLPGAIHAGRERGPHPVYIEFGRNGEIISYPPQSTELARSIGSIPDSEIRTFTRIEPGSQSQRTYIGMRMRIDGTPFFISQAFPFDAVDDNNPVLLLIMSGVMALMIIGSAFLLWRSRHRELLLRTDLAKEIFLKREIA